MGSCSSGEQHLRCALLLLLQQFFPGGWGPRGVAQVNPVCRIPGPAELASPHILRVVQNQLGITPSSGSEFQPQGFTSKLQHTHISTIPTSSFCSSSPKGGGCPQQLLLCPICVCWPL